MKARHLIIILVGFVLVLGACAGKAPPPPVMTAIAPTTQPAPDVTPALTPAPSPAPTADAQPTEQPGVIPVVEEPAFNIGVPAGDAFGPMSVAVDAARGIAYVYHGDSAENRPVISVVDLAGGQVSKVIRLSRTAPTGGGRLLLGPDGARLYLIDSQDETLLPIEVATGNPGPAVPEIMDGLLSEDGQILYAIGPWGLRAWVLADLLGTGGAPLWEASGVSFGWLVGSGGRLLASTSGTERELRSFDARTGAEVARVAVPDHPVALAAGPNGGWAVALSGEKARLIRYDASLEQIGETEVPFINDLTYDPARQRYLVSGYQPAGGIDARPVLLSLDAGSLRVIVKRDWPGSQAPTVFVPWGGDRLIGFTPAGPARLELLDAGSLTPGGRIITGVQATDIALDDGSGTLYVADDHERIHVLKLPEGREIGLWEGGAPLVLDGANRRLYANSVSGVRALDMGTGEVVASFSQAGYAAPDPNRDVVYIARRGVTVFDRNGTQLGTLKTTFPVENGYNPNPYAYAAIVNPITGHAGVVLNNGVPGSNNGSFLRIYPSMSDQPVEVGGPHSFVLDVLTDRSGNWYVAYSPARGQEAIQVLSPSGKELRRLAGRTGEMALDEANGRLYLLLEGSVTLLDASSLTPTDFYIGPGHVDSMAFSPSRRALYVASGDSPRVETWSLESLRDVDLRPQPGSPVQQASHYSDYGLAVATDGRSSWVVAAFDELYRTRDGVTWERLPVGLQSRWGYVTTAEPNTIFFAGQSSLGADGVWRSSDAGDTWKLLAAGLTDLRPSGPVLARGADEAYFLNQSQGLLRWDPAAQKWQELEGKPADGEWGEITLAPDGVLFRAGTDLLARSDDRGASWEMLKPPGKSGQIIGFTPLYTVTHTLFGVWGDLDQKLLRSPDSGETWEPVAGMIDFSAEFYSPQMASGFGDLYLLARRISNPAVLFRSTNLGETWLVAPAGTAGEAENLAVDPANGRLWLGVQGGVRALAPDDVQWLPVSSDTLAAILTPVSTGTPIPTATATRAPLPELHGLQPTATAGPCNTPLTGADSELNAQGLGLGCPLGAATSVDTARQRFQNGKMIWRGDQRRIYVLYNDGRWEGYADEWVEGEPADDPALRPPDGLQQPVRGFGRLWRDTLGGATAAIGWALEKEQGQPAQVQDWDHGTVLRFGGEMIILLDGGVWR